jgi:hypothetical protein
MKVFKQTILMSTLIMAFSVLASAHKNDQKKPPPKDPPPVITPGDKNRPRENPPPRNNDRDRGGKKPGIAFVVAGKELTIQF